MTIDPDLGQLRLEQDWMNESMVSSNHIALSPVTHAGILFPL
ncbi:hypothetical protein [Paenibacillus phytorum]|nr:hypothetical protein [Paenibacillus phytorum]